MGSTSTIWLAWSMILICLLKKNLQDNLTIDIHTYVQQIYWWLVLDIVNEIKDFACLDMIKYALRLLKLEGNKEWNDADTFVDYSFKEQM